jgi:8-oxo-dGTP pyrophosphatase MutT (NUDIX family)
MGGKPSTQAVDAPQLVAIGLLTSGPRVLPTRRAKNGPFPGLWKFSDGKVGFGEHPWKALRHELREELRMPVSRGDLSGIYSHVYDFGGTRVHYVIVAYRVRIQQSRIASAENWK